MMDIGSDGEIKRMKDDWPSVQAQQSRNPVPFFPYFWPNRSSALPDSAPSLHLSLFHVTLTPQSRDFSTSPPGLVFFFSSHTADRKNRAKHTATSMAVRLPRYPAVTPSISSPFIEPLSPSRPWSFIFLHQFLVTVIQTKEFGAMNPPLIRNSWGNRGGDFRSFKEGSNGRKEEGGRRDFKRSCMRTFFPQVSVFILMFQILFTVSQILTIELAFIEFDLSFRIWFEQFRFGLN